MSRGPSDTLVDFSVAPASWRIHEKNTLRSFPPSSWLSNSVFVNRADGGPRDWNFRLYLSHFVTFLYMK